MTTESKEKPVVLTVVLIVIAIFLTPVPGVDVIYDILAFFFIGKSWFQYLTQAHDTASTYQRTVEHYSNPETASLSAAECFSRGQAASEQGNAPEAFAWFIRAADTGNPHAMNQVAIACFYGVGTPKSIWQTARWLEKSIAHGEHGFAPKTLYDWIVAEFIQAGISDQQLTEAARLCRVAADAGYVPAQRTLGALYLQGRGVDADPAEARLWLTKAADKGDAEARRLLAQMNDGDSGSRPSSGHGGMSRAAALACLGLRDGASEDDIRAAHRRLIQQVHPDKGGSDWLAQQLNEARDVLLATRV